MKICNFEIGNDKPLFLIAGTCVVESEAISLETAGKLKEITQKLGINFIYKSSFEKANRTSVSGFTGLGFEKGLEVLAKVKKEIGVPILTDVHDDTPIDEVAEVADVLQTPAFLCRQTNFIRRVMAAGKPVDIKKGQFLSPREMFKVVEKAKASGNDQVMVCERGFCFGYNNLVVDMRSLAILRETGCPVIFDAGHSVQLPGAQGNATGGEPEFIPVLARAAAAVGIAGLYLETHPNPAKAFSDGPNSLPLNQMENLLITLKQLDSVIKKI